MPPWSAEFTVDEERARELISRFFVPRSLRLLGEGWDNSVWLADERWVFRFPRRRIAVPLIRREIAVLGELAPQLPLPIPVPHFVGDDHFGARHIPGRELPGTAPGRALGEFLRALHDARVSVELPDDPMGRADMPVRVPRAIDALAAIGRDAPAWLHEARALPRPAPSCVVHGDLHLRHVLVDGGAISGVIDWGDVCRGDPSVDLPLYWSSLSGDGRSEFLAAYGPLSEEQLLRGRVLAVFLCAVLADYAAAERMDDLARETLAGLDRAM